MTFEDVKNIRQNPTMADVDNKELSTMIDVALEKQIPKKVRETGIADGVCPCCNNAFYFDYSPKPNYCKKCGQALLWESEE